MLDPIAIQLKIFIGCGYGGFEILVGLCQVSTDSTPVVWEHCFVSCAVIDFFNTDHGYDVRIP